MTTDNTSAGQVDPNFKPSMDEPSKEGTYGDTPLADFWAQGAGYVVRTGIGKTSQKPWRRVELRGQLGQGDVLETVDNTVYPFPYSEISLFYNEPNESFKRIEGRGISDWEALSESVRTLYGESYKGWETFEEVFGGGIANPDAGQLPAKMGKRYRMKRVPTLLNVGPNDNNSKWHDEMKLAWKVVEIEGVGRLPEYAEGGTGGTENGASMRDHILTMADGKTKEAFLQAALDDDLVMKDSKMVGQLTDPNGDFVKTMETAGLVTVDADGVIHKV